MISDILKIIAQYAAEYKLRDWIQPSKIDWERLSWNPNPQALDLLKKNPDKIEWNWLSLNPFIFKLNLIKYRDSKKAWLAWYNLL